MKTFWTFAGIFLLAVAITAGMTAVLMVALRVLHQTVAWIPALGFGDTFALMVVVSILRSLPLYSGSFNARSRKDRD